jgi:hypothetical protein
MDCPQHLSCPCNIVVSGPTQVGKSTFVEQLILSDCLQPRASVIKYVYGAWQPAFERLQRQLPDIEFIDGWQTDLSERFNPNNTNLLILDDIVSSCKNDTALSDLFTKGCHHRNVSVILITQNYFFAGSSGVDVRRNTQYLALFPCRQDQRQVARFAQQIFPANWKYFMQAYADAVRPRFGYLFVDMHHECDPRFSLRANILNKYVTVYLPD